ncbi:hypothetical protein R5W60_05450 [Brucella pseudintermedia]|uniref:hypothetical protein n=1 Tax=Brucella pseudintermedia TaxID=370111 RepID=UPI00366EAFFB|nr:hypothetical protein R5W60_05450 [Brucella pseudintermedia]
MSLIDVLLSRFDNTLSLSMAIVDAMETRLTKPNKGLRIVTGDTGGNPVSLRDENFISIGEAAWRVLGKARKAAIARHEKGADAQTRNNGMFQVPAKSMTSLVAPKPGASASTVEDPATIGRSRNKRSTGI